MMTVVGKEIGISAIPDAKRNMRSKRTAVVIVACIAGLASFVLLFTRSTRISIPQMPSIDQITVTANGDKPIAIIIDPRQIANVLSFLNGHDRGWRLPSYTFPSPMYSARFEAKGTCQYVFWISSPAANWIGFRAAGDSAPDNLLRQISPAEYADLLARLGVPPQP